jgi:hypothetical protein
VQGSLIDRGRAKGSPSTSCERLPNTMLQPHGQQQIFLNLSAGQRKEKRGFENWCRNSWALHGDSSSDWSRSPLAGNSAWAWRAGSQKFRGKTRLPQLFSPQEKKSNETTKPSPALVPSSFLLLTRPNPSPTLLPTTTSSSSYHLHHHHHLPPTPNQPLHYFLPNRKRQGHTRLSFFALHVAHHERHPLQKNFCLSFPFRRYELVLDGKIRSPLLHFSLLHQPQREIPRFSSKSICSSLTSSSLHFSATDSSP